MPHQTENDIIDDILHYLREHESVCIETERESGINWVRECDGKWQLIKQTGQDSLTSTTVDEGAVRAILKANYYQIIPADRARTAEISASAWEEVEDEENRS